MKITSNPFLYALGLALLTCICFFPSSEAFDKNLQNNIDPVCSVELRELMVSLARMKDKSFRFKEEKYLSILEEPLKAEGTLHFRPPDYLEKIITKPQKERLVVENGLVSIFTDQDSRSFSLNDYPPLRELLNGIRFTLIGNLDALREYYELNLIGNCHEWSLTLVQKSVSTMTIIDRIIFLGEKDNIVKITWVESSGDFTIMTIEN